MKIPRPGETRVVIIPPNKITTIINKWRKKYHHQARKIKSHITVAYQFVPLIAWSKERPHVIKCLNEFHEFDISLSRLGVFSGPPLCSLVKIRQ